MKDKHDIWTYLREQIQGHPELRQQPLLRGSGTWQRCFACDEMIREEHSGASQYHCREGLGQVHWFHPACEAILEKARHPSSKDLVEARRRQDASLGR
jgi:hypothetical protein